MVVYRALCDVDKIADKWTLPTYGNIFMAPGKHFLVFPISRNKTLSVVAFVSTPRENLGDVIESYTLKGNKDAVKNEFKDFAPEVQAVIQNMEQKPLKWILFDRPSTARWNFSGGKVVLLGDAAHAMCPHQGKLVLYCQGSMLTFFFQEPELVKLSKMATSSGEFSAITSMPN